MFLTREEAVVVIYDLINSGILDPRLCDELTNIANSITNETYGLDTWGADDEVADLFVAKREDLITDEWKRHVEELYEKYKIKNVDIS